MNIERAILNECQKLIRRQQKAVAGNNAHQHRYKKVTGLAPGDSSHIPPHWMVHWSFNPYKVRRKAQLIAKSIQHQLEEQRLDSGDLHQVLHDVRCIYLIAAVQSVTEDS